MGCDVILRIWGRRRDRNALRTLCDDLLLENEAKLKQLLEGRQISIDGLERLEPRKPRGTGPQAIAGYVYYARLKTKFGPLYKLGYTSLGSVQERLAYQGKGHDRLIDVVLAFAPFDNALEVEQRLHAKFAHRQAFPKHLQHPDDPLQGNGSSEIYATDVLKLEDVSEDILLEREYAVEESLMRERMKRAGQSSERIAEKLAVTAESRNVIVAIARRLGWLSRMLAKLNLWLDSDRAKAHARVIEDDIASLKQNAEQRRASRPMYGNEVYYLAVDVNKAIQAFRSGDLQAFEDLLDVDQAAVSFADAMTDDYIFGSDYMGVACNCGLLALVDAMAEGKGSPRDLLLRPVEATYRAILRHWVKTGRLLTEGIFLPEGPLYRIEASDDRCGLALYFGVGTLVHDCGRHWWIAPNTPATKLHGAIEFPLQVRNEATGFQGSLTIRVTRSKQDGRLNLEFPDLLDLHEAADAAMQALKPPSEQRFEHRNAERRRRKALLEEGGPLPP
jgi:Meiotically Up-regulated Gene 113 (MUG113) protein